MGGYDDDSNMDDSKRAERKFKKHMVEKRRRNRINYALDQLKMMVLEGLDKDPTKYDKMEKADILDLTVKYLHRILKENIHLGPEMMQALPPMFGEHFAGGFLHHPSLPPPHSILPEPCSSSTLFDEPLDLHSKVAVTSQSSVASAASPSSATSPTTSRSCPESPCIDVDSDSDLSEDEKSDTTKGFKPVKKHSEHTAVKRSINVYQDNDNVPSKRTRTESEPMPNPSTSFASIKLNITGQAVPSYNPGLHNKPGPPIVRPVATVPRLSLRTNTNSNPKSFPAFPYPGHPFPGMGAPLVPLPTMHGELSWRPW